MNPEAVSQIQLRSASLREIILSRRSCRSFTDQPISGQIVDQLIEAGIYAPSGSNAQNQRFLVMQDPNEIQQLGGVRFVWPYPSRKDMRGIVASGVVGRAETVIMIFSDAALTDRRNRGEYHIWESLEIQNTAASIQNILLMATSLGIGSCWISASDTMNYTRLMSKQAWRDALPGYEIPASYKLRGIILLGYPKSTDALHYAAGDKMHGTTWDNVERRPPQWYLVKRSDNPSSPPARGCLDQACKALLRSMIRFCLGFARFCDKLTYRIDRRHLP